MTGSTTPSDGPDGARRLDNGLIAAAYVPLTDIEQAVGPLLLSALSRARIAAYLEPSPQQHPDSTDARYRLFVASAERADARAIVASAVRPLEPGSAPSPSPRDPAPASEPPAAPVTDPLQGIDTDTAFAELVADWHVDTIAAVRAAERELRREDADWRERLVRPAVDEPVWLDDDHYVPPPPPPLPRLAAPTIGAMALLAVSILFLGLGGAFGLATDLTMLLGVLGVLVGAWMLVMRLRDRPDDDDDDGAVV